MVPLNLSIEYFWLSRMRKVWSLHCNVYTQGPLHHQTVRQDNCIMTWLFSNNIEHWVWVWVWEMFKYLFKCTVNTCETPSSDWCSCLVCAAPDTLDAWHFTRDMLWHWQVVTRDTWHVVTRDTWNTRHAARMSSAMAATSVTCSSPMVCGMPATIMNSSAMLCTCGEHGPVSGTALWRSVLELQTIVREDFL